MSLIESDGMYGRLLGLPLRTNMKTLSAMSFVALMIAGLLAAFPGKTYGQDAPMVQPAPMTERLAADQAKALTTAVTRTKTERTKGDFVENNDKVWAALLAQCNPVNDACANAAVFAASAECEDSAKFFRKGTKGWTIFSIALTLASAGFTGVGASATLANAKIYSTLGGSTGLASVLPTLNANATGDQTGMTTVASTIAKLQTYSLGTGTGTTLTPPTAAALFLQARTYGATCAAAANSSPATNSSAPPSPKGGTSH